MSYSSPISEWKIEKEIQLLRKLYSHLDESTLLYRLEMMVSDGYNCEFIHKGSNGALIIYKKVPTMHDGNVILIDSLVSDGFGMGTQLLKKVEEENLGYKIKLDCPVCFSKSQTFYHKKGFNIRALSMIKKGESK